MKERNDFLKKDSDFRSLAKKAKRNSNIRVVLISIVVSIVVIFAFFYISSTILTKTMNKETRIDTMWNSIHGANIEQRGTSTNYHLFSATTKTEFNKVVDGISISWVQREKRYTIFGTSTAITTNGPSGSGHINDQRIPMYYNGERVIEFVHPEAEFSGTDDREIITEIGDDKAIEVALSFDKGYSLSKVQKEFGNNLAWLWVDTYSQTDIADFYNQSNETGKDTTIIGDDVIGFHYNQDPDTQYGANHFIETLEILNEKGKYQGLAKNIIQNVTSNHQKELIHENLDIIGVVITGTPSEVKELMENKMVRGVFLGVTTDKY
ncbi:sigma factor regulator [Melghiribacillus thermohalophilus]|uniref:Sigma factor regulator n=1 Tax=Melghiribacillus thermohalophilus TaxID=1324956 RepID=A0A4R3NAA9_9BACI|nr:anti sigma factor C-terminal domain-containing protein [Melghiribacillus thermohalophilus]TCT26382.1 sigma factor regulator [Melghiribacillus thermohalophilus]